jgi:hypothetical protein
MNFFIVDPTKDRRNNSPVFGNPNSPSAGINNDIKLLSNDSYIVPVDSVLTQIQYSYFNVCEPTTVKFTLDGESILEIPIGVDDLKEHIRFLYLRPLNVTAKKGQLFKVVSNANVNSILYMGGNSVPNFNIIRIEEPLSPEEENFNYNNLPSILDALFD